jgi:hypothetical protein
VAASAVWNTYVAAMLVLAKMINIYVTLVSLGQHHSASDVDQLRGFQHQCRSDALPAFQAPSSKCRFRRWLFV